MDTKVTEKTGEAAAETGSASDESGAAADAPDVAPEHTVADAADAESVRASDDEATAEDAVAGAGPVDPLLDCLDHVARHFGIAFSKGGALTGLPLDDGSLDARTFVRAAERFGIRAKLVSRPVERIAPMLLPVVLLLHDGDACIVSALDPAAGTAKVFHPRADPAVAWVPLDKLARAASGRLFLVTPQESPTAQGFYETTHDSGRRGHWFMGPVLRAWPTWIQVVFAALMVNLLGLAVPFFIMNVYDRVIPNLAVSTLVALSSGVAIALLFELILRHLRAVVLDRAGKRIDMGLAAQLFDRIVRLRMGEQRLGTGVTAAQVREFETVREVFTSQTVIALTDFAFIGIFVFAIWTIVGPIAWIPIVAVPVVLVLTILIRIPLARAVAVTQREANRRHGVLVESLAGIEAIRAANAEGTMQRKWEDAVAASSRASAAIRFWSSLVLHLSTLVQQSVGVLIIIWGVFLIGDGKITVGALIATNILASRVLAPLTSIAMTLVRVQQAVSALKTLNALMKLPVEASERGQGLAEDHGTIEFRNVSFTYPGAVRPAVQDIAFTIEPGERVGIIGRIGSGKTTLGKLLAGFYEADTGSIIVAGSDTRAHNPADLRARVGYVGQSPELFSGTVRDNIVMGRGQASDDDVARVVRLTGIDTFTAEHPLGLMMPVGERGEGLSGGQRQAVALARVMIRQPSALFLDEPSAALDFAAEQALAQELAGITDGARTLIVCTHSGAMLSVVDRLILIDQGKVIADGPREKVLALLNEKAAKRRKSAKGQAGDGQTPASAIAEGRQRVPVGTPAGDISVSVPRGAGPGGEAAS